MYNRDLESYKKDISMHLEKYPVRLDPRRDRGESATAAEVKFEKWPWFLYITQSIGIVNNNNCVPSVIYTYKDLTMM